MSIGGIMRTSVSGMNAQATRLGTVAENIANSDTTGYKQSQTEFSSLLLPQNSGGYNSGSVQAQVRTLISQQGGISYTGNSTTAQKIDLMVNGNGFFVVGDGSGGNYLTRAGSFTQQPDGSLVNAAGFTLQGYPVEADGTDNVLNGFGGLQDVNLSSALLSANPTTKGTLTTNLDEASDIVLTASNVLPSENAAAAPNTTVTYTAFSSIQVYDNSGKAVKLDIYYTKTAANTWEMTVFDGSQASSTSASTTAPFPYLASGTAVAPLTTSVLEFETSKYSLSSIVQDGGTAIAVNPDADDGVGNGIITIDVPGGGTMSLNISDTTQFTEDFLPLKAEVDGNPAEVIDKVSTSKDGTITATFTSGTTRDLFKVPLALVNSPDNLEPLAGNVYSAGVESGTILMGFGDSGGFGEIISGALEDSTVDLATELTTMIESQRSYTANSKVFQTGSEILDVLVNLKR
ncbi:MAG: flagellar hook protein FlgE [Rhizobiaceae bacterium]|nr:flagellar hook protein FlgE [Rhizobiaceae bacterium]